MAIQVYGLANLKMEGEYFQHNFGLKIQDPNKLTDVEKEYCYELIKDSKHIKKINIAKDGTIHYSCFTFKSHPSDTENIQYDGKKYYRFDDKSMNVWDDEENRIKGKKIHIPDHSAEIIATYTREEIYSWLKLGQKK